jgi:hypothetical protein
LSNGHPPWRAGLFCTEAAFTPSSPHQQNLHRSAPGQSPPKQAVRAMSDLSPTATRKPTSRTCSFVPTGEQLRAASSSCDASLRRGSAITITRGGPRRRSWQSLAPSCLILRRRATGTDGRPLPSGAPTAAAHRWASAFARPANRLPAPECALGRHFVRLRRRRRFD